MRCVADVVYVDAIVERPREQPSTVWAECDTESIVGRMVVEIHVFSSVVCPEGLQLPPCIDEKFGWMRSSASSADDGEGIAWQRGCGSVDPEGPAEARHLSHLLRGGARRQLDDPQIIVGEITEL